MVVAEADQLITSDIHGTFIVIQHGARMLIASIKQDHRIKGATLGYGSSFEKIKACQIFFRGQSDLDL